MNFQLTLFAFLTICTALVHANVQNRIRSEEEDDNVADEQAEEEEEEGNRRNALNELKFSIPERRYNVISRLFHSVTSAPKDDVIGDATAYASRDVKIQNLYLWMLLDGSDRGLKRSPRTKEDQAKDRERKDQQLQDHLEDRLRDRLQVRDSRRQKLAGLFKVNGSKDDEEGSPGNGECPLAADGQRLFFCPSPDEMGRHRCIDDQNLCDRMTDCPNAEDEEPTVCMFHGVTRTYFRLVIETILRLIRPLSYSTVQLGPPQSSAPPRRHSVRTGETAAFYGHSPSQRNGESGTEDIL